MIGRVTITHQLAQESDPPRVVGALVVHQVEQGFLHLRAVSLIHAVVYARAVLYRKDGVAVLYGWPVTLHVAMRGGARQTETLGATALLDEWGQAVADAVGDVVVARRGFG
jgi:hypothetical protein